MQLFISNLQEERRLYQAIRTVHANPPFLPVDHSHGALPVPPEELRFLAPSGNRAPSLHVARRTGFAAQDEQRSAFASPDSRTLRTVLLIRRPRPYGPHRARQFFLRCLGGATTRLEGPGTNVSEQIPSDYRGTKCKYAPHSALQGLGELVSREGQAQNRYSVRTRLFRLSPSSHRVIRVRHKRYASLVLIDNQCGHSLAFQTQSERKVAWTTPACQQHREGGTVIPADQGCTRTAFKASGAEIQSAYFRVAAASFLTASL